MKSNDQGWAEANQRYLMSALAEVRTAVERHLAKLHPEVPSSCPGEPVAQGRERDAGLADLTPHAEWSGPPPALATLQAAFVLSQFERDLLLLCAGPELDASFGALCAAAHGDERRPFATFGLALAALPGAHWSALSPAAPLRHWRLIEVGGGAALVSSALRIDERVLHHLAGVNYLDERLAGLARPLAAAEALVPSQRGAAERLQAAWSDGAPGLPLVQLCGPDQAAMRAVAAAAAGALGLGISMMKASAIPLNPAELESLLRLWEREAALSATALLIEAEAADVADAARERAIVEFVNAAAGAIIVACREPRRSIRRPAVTLEVAKPSRAEQRALWRSALGPAATALNGQVDALTAEFAFDASAIRAASFNALRQVTPRRFAAAGEPTASGSVEDPGLQSELSAALWEACLLQARYRLDDLAQRVEPAAGWDDLVLPEAQKEILREIAAHVRHRTTVYERWGFVNRGARGLGITALFAGPSGTGKTMAAEVVAQELRLDLYRIDLSAVISKYIGETEKNLRRVFDAAEEGGAILFFDEADALFGKRSEVKDSHDRYANIEISYLLQRMEAYRGLAILATNLKSALDPAFLRRIRFVVAFPFPDLAMRAQIWRRIFPPDTPTAGLDPERLAQLNVAGGNIRNIALGAAFRAAEAGEPVSMRHLLNAARGEYAKLEKALSEAEIRGWL